MFSTKTSPVLRVRMIGGLGNSQRNPTVRRVNNLHNIILVYYSELVLGSIEQKKEDRKQQLKDQAEEERRMQILTS